MQTFPSSASYYKLKRISELAVNVDDRKCQRFLQERPLVSLRKRRIIGLCLQLTLKGKRFVSDRFFQRLYKHSKRQCIGFAYNLSSLSRKMMPWWRLCSLNAAEAKWAVFCPGWPGERTRKIGHLLKRTVNEWKFHKWKSTSLADSLPCMYQFTIFKTIVAPTCT